VKARLVLICCLAACNLATAGAQESPSAVDTPTKSGVGPATIDSSASQVRNTYTRIVDALLNRDGRTASNLVTQETLDFYEQCRQAALDSSSIDFEQISQIEVVLIFQLRYLSSRDELSKMTGKDVFQWGVERGLVGEKGMKGVSLDRVQIDGDVAFATVFKDRKPVPGLAFRFAREYGAWVFDMLYISKAVEPVFAEVRKQAHKSKIELAIFLMERTYKKQIPFEILNGPLK
jgi:hypothetical protein